MNLFERIENWVGAYLSEIKGKKYDFSSVQFNMPEGIERKMIKWSKENIAKEDIYKKEGLGLEDNPHVTVLYGLHDEKPDAVRKAVNDYGKVDVVFGETTLFDSNPEFDVLKIDINGRRLSDLNQLLRKQPHTNSYSDYHAHATFAYLKKGKGKKYVNSDFKGQKCSFGTLIFSSKNGKKIKIPLNDK